MHEIDELLVGCVLPAVVCIIGICVSILIVLYTIGTILTMLGAWR